MHEISNTYISTLTKHEKIIQILQRKCHFIVRKIFVSREYLNHTVKLLPKEILSVGISNLKIHLCMFTIKFPPILM